jgi:hypothetical protein
MSKLPTITIAIIWFLGTIFALIQLYGSADNMQYPLKASLYYLGASLIIGFVVIKFRNNLSKKATIINNIIITLFTVEGVLFALICLYSLIPETRVDSLASSIFFFAGMLASSSIFFAKPKIQN